MDGGCGVDNVLIRLADDPRRGGGGGGGVFFTSVGFLVGTGGARKEAGG